MCQTWTGTFSLVEFDLEMTLNFVLQALQVQVQVAKRNAKRNLIETVADIKDFKKLLRTRNNVLVIFAKSGQFYFYAICVNYS